MKIRSTAIFVGNQTIEENTKQEHKSIFAGKKNQVIDPITKKKQEAQKKALKIVDNAWKNDKKIDDEEAMSRSNIKKYQENIGHMNDKVKEIEKKRTDLRDSLGIEEDAQEEQDLRLLEKQQDWMKGDPTVELTQDEWDRLAEIKRMGLTEYQDHSLEMRAHEEPFKKELKNAQTGIMMENAAIAALRQARNKTQQNMTNAKDNAEQIMITAAKEAVGMLLDDGIKHIDDKLEDEKEAAEKKAEEKEEQEKKTEKKEGKEAKQEQLKEQITDSTENMVELDNSMEDVQKEVKKIIKELNLTEEDLKGAAVDTYH